MSNFLISEPPLMVLPGLAAKIGLNEAIFLQQLHYWLLKSENIREGRRWVYNSISQWQKQFPFWSPRTLDNIVARLKKDNLIIIDRFNKLKIDKTNWYRINYEHELLQKGGTITQILRDQDANLARPIPETTPETTPYKLLKTIFERGEEASKYEGDFNEIRDAYDLGASRGGYREGLIAYIEALKRKEVTHEALLTAVKKYSAYSKAMKKEEYAYSLKRFIAGQFYKNDFEVPLNPNGPLYQWELEQRRLKEARDQIPG
mgnify:FL=1